MSRLTDALAGLDLNCDLDDEDLLSDVIVLGKIIDANTGAESFLMAVNDSIGAITQLGLIAAANSLAPSYANTDDEDDE